MSDSAGDRYSLVVPPAQDHPKYPTTARRGSRPIAFKHNQLTGWTKTHLPGEAVVSHAVTQFGPVGASDYNSARSQGDRHRDAVIESLGLEPKYGFEQNKTFYLLTDQQLVLATRSAMRNGPKDILQSAPLAEVRVHWFDHDAGAGNRFRHYVTDFGDGTCRSDRSPLTQIGRTAKSSNAHHFIESLGDHAGEIDGP